MAAVSTRAAAVDSLRQAIASSTGQQKSEAYERLYLTLYKQSDADQLLNLLEEWMTFEQQQGNIDKEGETRWDRLPC